MRVDSWIEGNEEKEGGARVQSCKEGKGVRVESWKDGMESGFMD